VCDLDYFYIIKYMCMPHGYLCPRKIKLQPNSAEAIYL
jgi:hypothetical protein